MTIWIFGTSVSAQRGGWSSRLGALTGEPIVNMSVGDQTSIMGFSRLSSTSNRFVPGDIVVWEYPLLDILMIDFFEEADILAAMLNAWHAAMIMGAHVIVLLVTPRRDVAAASDFEIRINAVAMEAAVSRVNLRDYFDSDDDLVEHYSSDRHIRLDSNLLDRLAAAVYEEITDCRKRPIPSRLARHPGPVWHWWTAEQMGATNILLRENSLVSAEVGWLDALGSESLHVPAHDRLICAVVMSYHSSGSLWCGHIFCPPASCRLPEQFNYPFLLRTTRIPCLRRKVERLWATPEYALQQGAWSDYGFVNSSDANPIEVVGVVTADHGTMQNDLPGPSCRRDETAEHDSTLTAPD